MTLSEAIGYQFSDRALIMLALTHRSISSDDPTVPNNERLEFLGDAVLQLVITDRLFVSFPTLAEGKLAKIRAGVVSKHSLAEVARSIGLGDLLELSPAEERNGGRSKDSILADAMEAVLGAVYLDGGLAPAAIIINRLWGEKVDEKAKRPGNADYKTRLQEVVAKTGERPEYRTVGVGPDHARNFTGEVSVSGTVLGIGKGLSKKEAEQAAARIALQTIKRDRRR